MSIIYRSSVSAYSDPINRFCFVEEAAEAASGKSQAGRNTLARSFLPVRILEQDRVDYSTLLSRTVHISINISTSNINLSTDQSH